MISQEKPSVFVVMPFNDDFFALYEYLKKTFENDFVFINAGDLDNQQNIIQDIVEGIHRASIIIADLTGLNANVFYELGLAHAMNKKVIIITQDIGELPFDIKSYRANEYSLQFNKIPELVKTLEKLLRGAIDGTVKFGNPVSDYVPNYACFTGQNNANQIVSGTSNVEETEGREDNMDNGFLDDIANIVENTELMTAEICGMGADMRKMTQAVNSSSDEINRVKSQSGQADAIFVRNICRKLAEPVQDFSDKLKERVENTTQYWAVVENSFLSLLDNRFTQNSKNIHSIQENIDSLHETQRAMHDSDEKIQSFIVVLRSTVGIERRLTKAISAAIYGLEAYLTMMGTISASIDRIIRKAAIVTSQNHTEAPDSTI